jgi:hypothetical protein
METKIQKSKQNRRIYTYVFGLLFIAVFVFALLMHHYHVDDMKLLLIFSILSTIAETYLILLPKYGAVSVSFAITFSAILLTNPLTAAIITTAGVLFRYPYVDGRGRVHLFNNQLYKTIYNVSQSIISAGMAGVVYILIDTKLSFGFVFFNPIASFFSLTVYIFLNTILMAKLMSLVLNENMLSIWKTNLLSMIINVILVSMLGIVVAFSYDSYSFGGILLFFIPLMLARHTFKLYIDMRKNYLTPSIY